MPKKKLKKLLSLVLAITFLAISTALTPAEEVQIAHIEGANPAGNPNMGELLIINRSAVTYLPVPGADFKVVSNNEEQDTVELTTNELGRTFPILLPVGEYILVLPSSQTIPLEILPNVLLQVTIDNQIAPEPELLPEYEISEEAPQAPIVNVIETVAVSQNKGTIEIVTRAAQSGNPLSGGVFAIYRAYDNQLIENITIGAGGTASLNLYSGQYFIQEQHPTFGFLLEPHRIFLELAEGEIATVELTKERDRSILDAYVNAGIIYIPPTGEHISLIHYLGGALLLLIAFICGSLILKELNGGNFYG